MTTKAREQKLVVFSGQGYSILKRGSSLYVTASETGKARLYKSLGTDNIVVAKGEARKLYTKYIKGDQVTANRKILGDAWTEFDKVREAKVLNTKLDQATLTRSRTAWNRMKFFWDDKGPGDLTEENWELFAAEMESTFPGCSLQNEHKYITALARYCVRKGYLEAKNWHEFELSKTKEKPINPRRALENSELKSLIAAADDEEVTDWRGRLLVYCGVFHGMRISEIPGMMVQNLFEQNGVWYLKIENTKTDEPRTIAVNKRVLPLLQQAAKNAQGRWIVPMVRNPNEPINVQTIEERWRDVRDEADVDAYFHELRHTAITEAVKKHELIRVSLYFGVSVKTLLDTYVHLKPNDYAHVAESVEVQQ
jgi:integrase